jgi:hypothetical protein
MSRDLKEIVNADDSGDVERERGLVAERHTD